MSSEAKTATPDEVMTASRRRHIWNDPETSDAARTRYEIECLETVLTGILCALSPKQRGVVLRAVRNGGFLPAESEDE